MDMNDQKQLYIHQKPMVPLPLEPYLSTLTYPVYCQPKLDGFRCWCYYSKEEDTIILQSIKGKRFQHVLAFQQEMKTFFQSNPNIILDGELYAKGKTSHGVTSEMAKPNPEVHYLIFDGFHAEYPLMTFEDRWSYIVHGFKKHKHIHVHLLSTIKADSEKELEKIRSTYIEEGMEGLIVRRPEGVYEWNKRSKYVLKSKDFKEALFKIVGCKPCKGMCEGAVVFQLKCLHSDKTFWSMSTGTLEERRTIYKQRAKYIGKYVHVRYFLGNATTGCVQRNPIVLLEKGFHSS
jgi:ATP-dependent DNA ligase